MHPQNVDINEEINISKLLVKFNPNKMLFCADKNFCTGVCGKAQAQVMLILT